ncbi:OB-fold nucleic acid binding domain-containing protein [Candidatus Hecatella orcuttiae]|uniref:OB-fold nucleic acid binding domain-containing protein n=1 Tax=Candidatus Hecatella orcuttiae TaxID=1935119 RepID=UPI0028680F59|nr:OB-fold nucleic acid binding domain-containing protein [Candidatus Hecatella orcuttiae]
MKISELHVGMRSVNIQGKVLEISEPRTVISRITNRPNRVATAVLADESGKINLALWNEQIDSVKLEDDVQIENGYVSEFRGIKQLNIGRYGSLKVLP